LSYRYAILPLVEELSHKFDFDWIDLHWTYPDLEGGIELARRYRKPLSVTIRGKSALNIFSRPGSQPDVRQERSLRTFHLNRLLKKADMVISVSHELKDLIYRIGVHSERIHVIPNGVDTSLFYPMVQKDCRDRLGLNPEEKIVLAVGSLIYGKGFDRLIAIWPDLIARYQAAKLLIIGAAGTGGGRAKQLRAMVATRDLEDCVTFIGHVQHAKLSLWYNAADLFCLSSRTEGSPNVLNEALACGCPVVATDVGEVKRVMHDTSMGIVTNNSSSALFKGLIKTLGENFDRKLIAAKMQARTWDACAQNLMNVFEKFRK